MKIIVSELSSAQLAALINEAAAELARRATAPLVERVKHAQRVDLVREPAPGDKAFALRIKTRLAAGGYIKAAERDRIAGMSAEFKPWLQLQELPTGSSAGGWRRAAEAASIRTADEQ